jgi:protein-tyrosine-phosphatase
MKILFVCSGNTCRSPMAEALFRDLVAARGCGARFEIGSAGISAIDGDPASDGARAVVTGLEAHRSRAVTGDLVADQDLIVTMTKSHARSLLASHSPLRARVVSLGDLAGSGGDVADPFLAGIEAYRVTRDQIQALLDLALERI